MMGRFTPPFTVTQQKVLALVPKVTSSLSIIGSFYIIQHASRILLCHNQHGNTQRRGQGGGVYHRILLIMSFHDMIYSIKSFVSTWPMPAGAPFVWAAVGTTETCTAAGFLGHGAALTSALYNFSLTIYFLMSITFSWNETRIRKLLEPWLHLVPVCIGWSTAIVGIPLDLYNPIGWTCWIGTYPPGCGSQTFPCQRGNADRVDVYRWAFFHAELWFMFVLSALAMVVMCVSVYRKERAMQKYEFAQSSVESSSSSKNSERPISLSRRVTVQAALYIMFFFTTWIFPMTQFVVSQRTGDLYFPLLVLTVILSPLQGFFDCIIYIRPRYLHYRNKQRQTTSSQRLLVVHAAGRADAALAAMSRIDIGVQGETYDPIEDPADDSTYKHKNDRAYQDENHAEFEET